MRERLTADDLFSYVLILRPSEKRLIVLIEGDADYAALRTHIDLAEVNLIPGYGKSIIQEAMTLVNNHQLANVAALLDKDFGELLPGIHRTESNFFYTDHYDLDATIFYSDDVCERVAHNFGDSEQINNLVGDLESRLVDVAVNLSLALGVIRYISVRDGLGLKLRDFPLGEVVRDDCRGVDLDALATMAIRRSANQAILPRDLVSQVHAEMVNVSSPLTYCSGHDLARALSVMLRKRGGVAMKPETIERALRVAFGCSEIRAMSMYSGLAQWAQQRNKGFWACDSHR